jgi:hypothetical protein
MVQTVLGGFLVVHGLITTMIGVVGVTSPSAPALAMPSWLSWWPGPFGRSWLFEALNLGSGVAVAGGLLWLGAGVVLVIGGLGWIGVPALTDVKVPMLVAGASLGLVALVLYFHPFYLIGVLINLAVITLLWGRLAPAAS